MSDHVERLVGRWASEIGEHPDEPILRHDAQWWLGEIAAMIEADPELIGLGPKGIARHLKRLARPHRQRCTRGRVMAEVGPMGLTQNKPAG